jgi:hypothetical protein
MSATTVDSESLIATLQVRLEAVAAYLRSSGADPRHVETCEASARLLGGFAEYRAGIDKAFKKLEGAKA